MMVRLLIRIQDGDVAVYYFNFNFILKGLAYYITLITTCYVGT